MSFYTIGSGFFVEFKEDIYIVTNKHVLDNLDNYYISLYNSTLDNRRFIHITPDKSHLICRTYHPIPEVDIAIVKLSPLLYKHLQIHSIPILDVGMTLDSMESNMVYEGSEVYLLGHPLNLTTASNMYPICRQGTIALISNIFATKLNSKTFLIDCFAFPWNSGGPVFLKPELIRFNNEKSLNKTYLIGVVSSSIVSVDKTINTGLSVIISIDHVFDCLKLMEGK
jgi:S1-C subfamily serine protease